MPWINSYDALPYKKENEYIQYLSIDQFKLPLSYPMRTCGLSDAQHLYSRCRSVFKKDCYCIHLNFRKSTKFWWYAIAVFFKNASTPRVVNPAALGLAVMHSQRWVGDPAWAHPSSSEQKERRRGSSARDSGCHVYSGVICRQVCVRGA